MRLPRSIQPYGPTALLLNWQQDIGPTISRGVHAYARALREVNGVLSCIPAYASLLIRFNPADISADRLREYCYDLRPPDSVPLAGRDHELPVCYDGPDLLSAARILGLQPEALVALHTGREYLVYQLGFRPGFGFLGQTDARLEIDRLATPRLQVPAGSVGIAGRQTGVYPSPSPGGWQLIGRCPLPMLRPEEDFARLHAGDRVRFRAIDRSTYDHLLNTPTPWPVP